MQKILNRSSSYLQRTRSFSVSGKMDNVVKVYKDLARISDVKEARIISVASNIERNDQDVYVQVSWSSRNLSSLERVYTSCDYLIQGNSVCAFQPVPTNKNMVLSRQSPSGRWTAHVITSEKEKEVQQMIIVGRDGSMITFDLKAADKHGKVYSDNEFSCLEWSADETKVAYVAEKKRPEATSFVAKPKSDAEDTRGQEFSYQDGWGEQLEGKHQSVVCILDVSSGEVTCHSLPDHLCAGQLVWAPGDAGVIGVAFVSEPYRLGLVYCPNRESKLFHIDLEGNYNELVGGCSNLRSPRLSPDGSNIAFLRSTVGGPHAKSAQLCLISWSDKQEKVVIDVVLREKIIEEGHVFKGVYGYSGLPRRCWLSDSKRLVFSTFKFDNIVSYVVNTETGSITELPHLGSLRVHDVYDNWVLFDFTYVCQPSQIMLGRLPGVGQERNVKLQEVTVRRDVPGVPASYHANWHFVNSTPHPEPKFSDIPVSVIYYGPTSLEEGAPKRPLICWPHGGPHSTLINAFSPAATFFVKLGYSIVFPNFRGSLGFGEDGVNALPGHCGVVDVSDVHEATLACLKRFSNVLDETQVFLCGGSHGGFLVLHLAAQFPDVYKGVSSRNPVTDIPAMANVTDIPDWTFVETGHSFQYGKVADGAILSKMFAMSPISRIDAIKAPVLLLVGKNDRRVPPSQGINFHKMLRARNISTKLYIYDDSHPLSKVDVELDSLIHTALWFNNIRGSN